jgi:hypothetical protein
MKHEKVMIENLGAGEEFNHFLSKLKKKYLTKIIRRTIVAQFGEKRALEIISECKAEVKTNMGKK